MTLAFLWRCIAEFLAGLGHQLLEASSLWPGFVAERHGTAALAFAVVFAWMLAATALSFAVVHAVAVVTHNGGTVGLTRAVVGRPLLTIVLAGIDAPANVWVLKQTRQRTGFLVLVFGLILVFGLVLVIRGLARRAVATADNGAGSQPTQGRNSQAVQSAAVENRIDHRFPREKWVEDEPLDY